VWVGGRSIEREGGGGMYDEVFLQIGNVHQHFPKQISNFFNFL